MTASHFKNNDSLTTRLFICKFYLSNFAYKILRLKSCVLCPQSYVLCLVSCFFFISCSPQKVEYQTNDCKAQPSFIKKLGYNPARSALSTSEKKFVGLVLIQINNNGDTSHGGRTLYQDSTWKMTGWCGPLLIDPQGNAFVAPVPVINLIDNPPAKQNIIYRVDGSTGKMNMFIQLPTNAKANFANPYGLLGFSYLCETNTLYASSVHGSTRQTENGVLYAIDAATAKIIDKIENVDALGMGISYITGQRKLYFGSARTPDIFSITLNKNGKFTDNPTLACSIANLGPRGDDKARRIKFDKATGTMQVVGIEFNYNLTAPTEKQETVYNFRYNEEEKKWNNF